METRVSLKILTLTLQDGLSNAKGVLLPCASNFNGVATGENLCKIKIESLFNNSMLEYRDNKHKCDMPLEDDPKGIGRRLGLSILKIPNFVKSLITLMK